MTHIFTTEAQRFSLCGETGIEFDAQEDRYPKEAQHWGW